jgi:hypothetical protein
MADDEGPLPAPERLGLDPNAQARRDVGDGGCAPRAGPVVSLVGGTGLQGQDVGVEGARNLVGLGIEVRGQHARIQDIADLHQPGVVEIVESAGGNASNRESAYFGALKVTLTFVHKSAIFSPRCCTLVHPGKEDTVWRSKRPDQQAPRG